MEAYFDNPLDDDEYVVVIKDVIMCIKRYEAMPVLSELVGNLEEAFETFMHGYEVVTDEDKDIAKQLIKMEREL